MRVARGEGCRDAVDADDRPADAGCRADGDEGVHGGRSVDERFEPADEVRVVHIDDGSEQEQFGERHVHDVLGRSEKRGKRPAEHMTHAEVEQRDEEGDGYDEAPTHGACLGLEFFGGRLQARSGRGGAGARAAARLDGGGCVARAIDGGADRIDVDGVFVVVDGHGAGEQIHGDVRDALEVSHGAVDMCLARRAGHAAYIECLMSHVQPLS